MKVIKAPENFDNFTRKGNDNVSIFLAGGITDGQDWRESIISNLNKKYSSNDRVGILNPRREGFGKLEETEVYNQIKWEYDALKKCDIFAIMFCESKSVQPISMYELGKQLSLYNFELNTPNKILHAVIGVEEEYSLKDDIVVQLNLMGYPVDILRGSKEQRYEDFANKIAFRINSLF